MFGIKFKPKRFLGIDIGTSCIRVIEMGRRYQKFQLENYGEANTPSVSEKSFRISSNIERNVSPFDQNIAEAIKLICQEAGIQTKEVNFSIPDFSSFYTSFRIPVMNEDEIPEAIKYEVRPYIPFPLSEITLDWLITEGQPSKTPLKLLVVAIPKKIINQYQNIARLSDLKIRNLEPEVFALARAVISKKNNKQKKENKKGKEAGAEKEKEEIIGLIDMGARTTTCSIVKGGVLKTSHSFSFAGNELTERLARSLNIDYNKAREVRDRYGMALEDEQGQISEFDLKIVREVLTPLVDSILDDIKKVFRIFNADEGGEVEKIILTGGLALLPGLKKYFSNEFKKEIIIANPFLNISYPSILKETLEQRGPSYAVGVGLALKGLE